VPNWYRLKFDYEKGDHARIKFWKESDGEPEAWLIDTPNTSLISASTTEVWEHAEQETPSVPHPRSRYWDYIEFDYPGKLCYGCDEEDDDYYLIYTTNGGGDVACVIPYGQSSCNSSSSLGETFFLYAGATYKIEHWVYHWGPTCRMVAMLGSNSGPLTAEAPIEMGSVQDPTTWGAPKTYATTTYTAPLSADYFTKLFGISGGACFNHYSSISTRVHYISGADPRFLALPGPGQGACEEAAPVEVEDVPDDTEGEVFGAVTEGWGCETIYVYDHEVTTTGLVSRDTLTMYNAITGNFLEKGTDWTSQNDGKHFNITGPATKVIACYRNYVVNAGAKGLTRIVSPNEPKTSRYIAP
jgi:hypothetical protein